MDGTLWILQGALPDSRICKRHQGYHGGNERQQQEEEKQNTKETLKSFKYISRVDKFGSHIILFKFKV